MGEAAQKTSVGPKSREPVAGWKMVPKMSQRRRMQREALLSGSGLEPPLGAVVKFEGCSSIGGSA